MALAKGQKRIGRRPKKNWPKAKNALAEGQSPPQELEVSPRSGLYLLVYIFFFNRLRGFFFICNKERLSKVNFLNEEIIRRFWLGLGNFLQQAVLFCTETKRTNRGERYYKILYRVKQGPFNPKLYLIHSRDGTWWII